LDLAIGCDVLEHTFDLVALLSEVHRVLRPNGTALVCVPNAFNVFNRLTFLAGPLARAFTATGIHELWPDLLSLGLLYECTKAAGEGSASRLPERTSPATRTGVTPREAPRQVPPGRS
jgi:hypothetical protein